MAILSTVTAYGIEPVMAKDLMGLEVRFKKIARLILRCGYGFTDLTYVGRMNMPLELGLLLAWGKETLVVSRYPYKHLRSISDLSFGDIRYHHGRVSTLIHELSRWLEQYCSRRKLSLKTLMARYRKWQSIRRTLGPDFDRLSAQKIATVVGIAEDEFEIQWAGK